MSAPNRTRHQVTKAIPVRQARHPPAPPPKCPACESTPEPTLCHNCVVCGCPRGGAYVAARPLTRLSAARRAA